MLRSLFILITGMGIAFCLIAAPAAAQNQRSFVAAQGSDSNTCTFVAPCRTFAGAITQTSAGGEIVVLNSGGYGTLTITKSITISSIGVEGAITAHSAGAGITISVGSSDTVRIRGLTLIGGGVGTRGILVDSAQSVLIQSCSITGFTGDWVTYSASGPSNLNIIGMTVSDNGGNGITVAPGGGSEVTAYINDVHTQGNSIGILISGNVNATVSVGATDNGTGIEATGASATVMVTGSRASNNTGPGLLLDSSATMYVDRVQASGNALGWQVTNGGDIKSYGDNEINGNTTDTTMPKTARPAPHGSMTRLFMERARLASCSSSYSATQAAPVGAGAGWLKIMPSTPAARGSRARGRLATPRPSRR
jgi:hypothetical protein